MLDFHNLRARVLASKGVEPFPAIGVWKRFLDYIMYGVGILAPLALIPQVLQLYTTKSSAGLSLPTWVMLAVFNILWTIYGIVHRDKHIFFASIFMAFFNIIIVVGVLMY